MKGLIILPTIYEKIWAPKETPSGPDYSQVEGSNAWFWHSIHDTFGFEMRYADEVDVDSDTDIVFMFGVPYHNRLKVPPGLLDLDKKIKLVMWPGDLQCYGNQECLDGKLKVFERCDLITSAIYEFFKAKYPQFLFKHEFVPRWYAPAERYLNLDFNESPKMKCLVSGHCYSNPRVYPRRVYMIEKGEGMVEWGPPGYMGDSYAKLLHSYFCCATSSSIYNYAVAKHYEIPAVGSLLLTNRTEDLDRVGFIPGKHYVPISTENCIEKIRHCLENPEEYTNIRKEGMKYVRENHSLKNRMERFGKIFNRLLGT